MSDLENWWKSLPPVTKWLFTASFATTIAANFGLIPASWLVLDFYRLYRNFEIWRLVTPFIYHGRLGFPFLMNMMFLVRYGSSVEKDCFMNETADYLWMIIIGGLLLLLPGYFVPLPILGISLIMMIIYYWARKNPDIGMSFFFGLRFKAIYLPFVLIGFRILLGGTPISEIFGVLVGHIYYFLVDLVPLTHQRRIISTPQFLKDWFPGPNSRPLRPGEGARQGGYNWGTGVPLGGGRPQ
eukprot:TRINITY_DN681_c1_g2_i1.p1 TRINITY_DN681_c1_g2~~TRINITY_DN681_c1_g2_i1.p1  ORF type:complete len:256 (+),score=27.59 TRINITY_DN681_c1_g2_i1:51-770(+)